MDRTTESRRTTGAAHDAGTERRVKTSDTERRIHSPYGAESSGFVRVRGRFGKGTAADGGLDVDRPGAVYFDRMDRQLLLDRAIRFAESGHRGQVRKGTDVPYFTHPVAVAMMVLEHGHGIESAVVALLHDLIEDTPVDRDDIEARFGPTIAQAVVDLSEPDKAMPWEERKTVYVKRLATTAAPLALPACAADKTHNLRSILWDLDLARRDGRDPREVWSRFKRAPKKICAYHRAVANALAHRGFDGSLQAELARAIRTFAASVGVDPDDARFTP